MFDTLSLDVRMIVLKTFVFLRLRINPWQRMLRHFLLLWYFLINTFFLLNYIVIQNVDIQIQPTTLDGARALDPLCLVLFGTLNASTLPRGWKFQVFIPTLWSGSLGFCLLSNFDQSFSQNKQTLPDKSLSMLSDWIIQKHQLRNNQV